MNQNKINVNADNERVKSPVYNSKFLMNKELFYDFSSVSFYAIKKLFLIFFCLTTPLIVTYLIERNYDKVIGFGPIISFILLLIFLRVTRTIKISYERNLISAGKESTLNYELFEDKIVSNIDELKREYSYLQITKLFETKKFILLHIKHNLYITIEKSNLNASVDNVKAFLISKCTCVRKKKFISCVNDKKWCLVFLIAMIVVSVIGMVIGLTLKSGNLV